jgi:hypothetical protein
MGTKNGAQQQFWVAVFYEKMFDSSQEFLILLDQT